jgi:hypothetical protein
VKSAVTGLCIEISPFFSRILIKDTSRTRSFIFQKVINDMLNLLANKFCSAQQLARTTHSA